MENDDVTSSAPGASTAAASRSREVEPVVYDKRGIPIERGDIVKVFHYVGARRKRCYMYKQCLGPGSYKNGREQYVFFSHLNFNDTISSNDGPYHERPGSHLIDYEIVQSIKCDHEDRRRSRLHPASAAEGPSSTDGVTNE